LKNIRLTDGAQDIYLTGNPQITFFKVVYRRHTNFSQESIEQTFNGTVDFGRKVTCTVSRNGDLIHKVYLQVDLPSITATTAGTVAWVDKVGHALIDEVSLEIGGQTIDKQYGEWLEIWNELTQTEEKYDGYNTMIGHTSDLYTTSAAGGTIAGKTLYIPLQFWFCRNAGLALPLIALQYHEVKFNITFRPLAQLLESGSAYVGSPALNGSLYVDYIYLDTDERRQFAQVQHEYLIEQLQFSGAESFSNSAVKSKLALNHPVKELVWVMHLDSKSNANQHFDYTTSAGGDTLADAKLQLNGQDRFSTRKGTYFNLVQPYQHHTRVPQKGIYVYSFSLNPEQHQPSGSVNMSRIDNATLLLNTNTSLIAISKTSHTRHNSKNIVINCVCT